jgi:hypothetical protein
MPWLIRRIQTSILLLIKCMKENNNNNTICFPFKESLNECGLEAFKKANSDTSF